MKNQVADKSMRLNNNVNPLHRLSMIVDDRNGPSRPSMRFMDGLLTEKSLNFSLKKRLDYRKTREMNVDADDTQKKRSQKM